MTAAGHARLQEEIKHLKTVARPEVIAAIAEARAHGDLSENAEYHAARDKQSFIEGRVQDLEGMLARAEVIDVPSLSGNNVKFGATVKLVDDDTEQEVTYQLVGEYEADFDQGRISINAPIARALIGKAVGDSVEVRTPQGERYYEVLSVEFK